MVIDNFALLHFFHIQDKKLLSQVGQENFLVI